MEGKYLAAAKLQAIEFENAVKSLFLYRTRLKTLFQPQDDENTDKTVTMTNSPRVIKKGPFKLHHALLGSKTVYEISVPI